MLFYAFVPLRHLYGHPVPANWLVVAVNLLVLCAGDMRSRKCLETPVITKALI